MRIFRRELTAQLRKAAHGFPAVILTGPRRAGKTFLLRHAFPRASYHLLEDPDVLARLKADPRGWLEAVKTPAILDEIQNAPELFSYLRTRIDQGRRRYGEWLLTGSQEFGLMQRVVESMTGRAAIFHLAPLSYRESRSFNLLRGGFPEVLQKPDQRRIWFSSYIQTYLERDVRSLLAVKDLVTFRRFLALLASRHGQILNRSDLAAPLGVSVPTIGSWLDVLEATGHVILVPPYFENFGKRLIKSSKVYWVDSGIVCFLLGIGSLAELLRSPFMGPIFEGYVASEIIKNRANTGLSREIYFFRDQQGLEVDFIVPRSGGGLLLIETKWSRTILPTDARSLLRLRESMPKRAVDGVVVHRPGPERPGPSTVAPGVRACPVDVFSREFAPSPRARDKYNGRRKW